MTCKEKILSEDFVDLVIDFPLSEFFDITEEESNFCYQQLNSNIGIVSLNKDLLPEDIISAVDYQFFPDLLGVQQLESVEGTDFNISPLVESGIVQVQGAPLNLTGRGVLVAFVDTGEGVMILSKRPGLVKSGGLPVLLCKNMLYGRLFSVGISLFFHSKNHRCICLTRGTSGHPGFGHW